MNLERTYGALGAFILISLMISSIPGPLAGSPSQQGAPTRAENVLELILLDASGEPVPYVEVELTTLTGGGYRTNSTDAEGRCNVTIGPDIWGPVSIHALKEGPVPQWLNEETIVEPFSSRQLICDLTEVLRNNVTISGTVIDPTTGSVIDGAWVRLEGEDATHRPIEVVRTTDPSGGFQISVPPTATRYDLLIEADGYEDAVQEIHTIPGRNTYFPYIHMYPEEDPVSVSFELTDGAGGPVIPARDASLRGYETASDHCYVGRGMDTGESGIAGLIAKEGEYTFEILGGIPSRENVSVLYDGYLLVDDDHIHSEIPLDIPEEWGTIDITATDDVGPVNGTRITYSLDVGEGSGEYRILGDAISNATGIALIDIPSNEMIVLTALHPEGQTQTVTVLAGSAVLSRSVEFEGSPRPTGKVSIMVADTVTGTPVPGAILEGRMGDLTFEAMTAADGYYNGTIPAGVWDVIRAEHNLGSGAMADFNVPTVSVGLGTILLQRRSFPPDPTPVSFSLLDSKGDHTIISQGVVLRYQDGTVLTPRSDHNGRVYCNVPPGEVTVSLGDGSPGVPIRRSGWVMDPFTITFPDHADAFPDLYLEKAYPLFSIQGRVIDNSTGDPIPFQPIMSWSHSDQPLFDMDTGSDIDGYYRLWAMEDTTIEVVREGYFPWSAGMPVNTSLENYDILLDPIPDRTVGVSGTMVDKKGKPVPGWVRLVDVYHEDHIIDETTTLSNGTFSLTTYPGELVIDYGNDTIENAMWLIVPAEGLSGLELVLEPMNYINGTVKDHWGKELPGLDIMFENIDDPWSLDHAVSTDDSGRFSIFLPEANYRLIVPETNTSDRYTRTIYDFTGLEPMYLDIDLPRPAAGHISGTVTGNGGPYDGIGIPGIVVAVYVPDLIEYQETVTDDFGGYTFNHTIPMDEYVDLMIELPDRLLHVEGARSGYDEVMRNFVIALKFQTIDLTLEYINVPDQEWVNVTGHGPDGSGVFRNSDIWVQFSHPMDRIEWTIVPETYAVRSWSEDMTNVTLNVMGLLMPNTTYSITIKAEGTLSSEGYALWEFGDFVWNFTTGSDKGSLSLENAYVESYRGAYINVQAWGELDQTIYLVIDYLGSYRLDEVDPGSYWGEFYLYESKPGSMYTYHFSDSASGPDMAPEFAGSFYIRFDEEPYYPPDEPYEDFEPTPLGCLGFCGIALLVVVLVIVIASIASRIKAKYDEKKQESDAPE